MRLGAVLAAAALAMILPAAPSAAQTAPSVAATPDPARLAIARGLIEKIMPSDRRDAMIDQMVRPMVDNLRTAMMDAPAFAKARAQNPELADVMEAFVTEEMERSISLTKAAMPALMEAMARAYARQFALDELEAISAFFETKAGRSYALHAAAVVADPDVLAAQRELMTQAMAGLEERAEALKARLSEGVAEDD